MRPLRSYASPFADSIALVPYAMVQNILTSGVFKGGAYVNYLGDEGTAHPQSGANFEWLVALKNKFDSREFPKNQNISPKVVKGGV